MLAVKEEMMFDLFYITDVLLVSHIQRKFTKFKVVLKIKLKANGV